MNVLQSFIPLLILWGCVAADESGFCYTEEACGPSHWPGVCTAGQRQSPIVLERRGSVPLTQPLIFRNYHNVGNFHLTTDGIHGKIPTFDTQQNGDAFIEGGPIRQGLRYFFNQSHFHWGADGREDDSEHRIPGTTFEGEVHMVHFHQDYDTGVPDGDDQITVVAYFMERQEEDNPKLDAMVNLIHRAHESGHLSSHNQDELNKLFLSNATFDEILPPNYDRSVPYYSYEGSLTTPPCTETVKWIVMEETIKVSDRQIQTYFRDHVKDPGRTHTFRPVQPLNGRQIFYYPGNWDNNNNNNPFFGGGGGQGPFQIPPENPFPWQGQQQENSHKRRRSSSSSQGHNNNQEHHFYWRN